ncbi:MAG: hypothetical protein ABFD65_11045 [Candidatus Polarisedimenticolia bacterium]
MLKMSSILISLSLAILASTCTFAETDPPFLSQEEREAALEAALPLEGYPPAAEAEWTVKARFEDSKLHVDLLLSLSRTNDDQYVFDISWAVGEDICTQVRRAKPRDAADAARIARGLSVRHIRASGASAQELARLGAALETMNVPALPRYFDVTHPDITDIALHYYTGNVLRIRWFGAGVLHDDVPLMRWLTDLRRIALKEIAAADQRAMPK